jgi:hypothetical protein
VTHESYALLATIIPARRSNDLPESRQRSEGMDLPGVLHGCGVPHYVVFLLNIARVGSAGYKLRARRPSPVPLGVA